MAKWGAAAVLLACCAVVDAASGEVCGSNEEVAHDDLDPLSLLQQRVVKHKAGAATTPSGLDTRDGKHAASEPSEGLRHQAPAGSDKSLIQNKVKEMPSSMAPSMIAIPAKHSNTSVVVHATGIEGTGHHFYQAYFSALCRRLSKEHESHMHCHWPLAWSYGQQWEEDAKLFQDTVATLPGPHVLFPYTGSFPQGWPRTDHPDEVGLAKAAESAGMQARLLVLLRDVEEVLVADCIHRHMPGETGCESEAETLVRNGKDLLTQLRAIDRNTYRCIRYGDRAGTVKMMSWATGFDKEMLEDVFDETFEKTKVNESEAHAVSGLTSGIEKLFKEYNALCST